MKKIVILLVLLAFCTIIKAQEDISIGKYRKFESKILGGEVTYLVHLPDGYENSAKNYPVIYMMNGQSVTSFANASATVDDLSNERIPDMILIGISNTGVAGNYWSCPDDSGFVKGGDSFRQYLKAELIPEVNRNYRTNNFRILFGQSNSSLFVMHNLISDMDMFSWYALASPMFGWCPQFYNDKVRAFLSKNTSLNKKLYIDYGELDYIEVLNYINDFKAVLNQSSANFRWKVDMVENAGHVPGISLNNALLYFFAECTMTAERKKLNIQEIKSHFEKLSKEYGFPVYPKAGVLGDMAVDMRNAKEYDRAIELFRYLISLYPGSEVYSYHLGLTYLLNGDTAHAKECFTESLKINPGYKQAQKQLDALIKKD